MTVVVIEIVLGITMPRAVRRMSMLPGLQVAEVTITVLYPGLQVSMHVTPRE